MDECYLGARENVFVFGAQGTAFPRENLSHEYDEQQRSRYASGETVLRKQTTSVAFALRQESLCTQHCSNLQLDASDACLFFPAKAVLAAVL